MTRKDAAKILGVSPDSSAKEARNAYKRLMQKCHPDMGGDEDSAKELTSAWRAFSRAVMEDAIAASGTVMDSRLFNAVRADDPYIIRALAADMNEVDVRIRDENGETLLHVAARHNACRSIMALADLGVDINARVSDNCGYAPLHVAVRENSPEAAILLAHLGADVNIQDLAYGDTPLHSTVIHKDPSVIYALLRHGADVKIGDKQGMSPGHGDSVLREHESKTGIGRMGYPTALHLAVRNLRLGLIMDLAEYPPGINAEDQDGNTPFHWAVSLVSNLEWEYSPDLRATELWCTERDRDVFEIADVLVKCGANINARNADGLYPMHIAALRSPAAIDYLIALGADLSPRDNEGKTPMHHIAQAGRKDALCRKILIAHLARKGAFVNLKDSSGNTPLDLAASEYERKKKGFFYTPSDIYVRELRRRGGKFGEDLPDRLLGLPKK